MRWFTSFFLFIIVILTILIVALKFDVFNQLADIKNNEMPKIESEQQLKQPSLQFDDTVFALMGKSSSEVINLLGEPERKDKTPYNYNWWIYKGEGTYIQVGMKDETVETVFATGDQLDSAPIVVGDSYENLKSKFPLSQRVTYEKGISHYTFLLTDDDIKTNPLIKLEENLFVQCYVDQFTEKISSIRIITGQLLTLQRFYEMEYRGPLPDELRLSETEWREVEKAMEKQIFDLTNVHRELNGVTPLSYDEIVSEVAYLHSKDMFDQKYFSHESKDGRGLKERLDQKSIHYLIAGENIAAQHSDAPAVIEGWLNSEGHRETLLNDQYNYLGVGVHRLYYTQNFIFKH